tara:strand:+ start:16 stop:348 length:333 start_codon:yes stop_codon:yes gene_type:complete
MSSYKTNTKLRPENIKSLENYVKPEIIRDKHGKTISVGMEEGQRFVRWDKTKGISSFSDVYDVSLQEPWRQFYYKDEIAKLIDDGLIYIKYVKKEPELLVETPDNQMKMF